MARATYDRGEMDAFVLTRALSTFERSLISGNSRYDQFFFQNKNNVLTDAEIRGMDFFLEIKQVVPIVTMILILRIILLKIMDFMKTIPTLEGFD